MKNETLRSQDNWINALRGFAIVVILARHLPYNMQHVNFMFSLRVVSVQIFFVLSGYLYNMEKHSANSLLNEAKSKIIGWGVPYLLLAFGNMTLVGILSIISTGGAEEFITKMPKYLYGIFYGESNYMPNCTPLWYIPCAMVTYIVFWFITKYCNKWLRCGVILLLIITYWYISPSGYTQWIWHAEIAILGVGFMYLGFLIRTYEPYIMAKLSRRTAVFVLVICLCIGLYFSDKVGYVDLDNLYVGDSLWSTYLITLVIVGPLIGIFKILNIKSKCLSLLGRNTLLIMGFNLVVMELIEKILFEFMNPLVTMAAWWVELFLVAIAFAGILWIYECAALVLKKARANKE